MQYLVDMNYDYSKMMADGVGYAVVDRVKRPDLTLNEVVRSEIISIKSGKVFVTNDFTKMLDKLNILKESKAEKITIHGVCSK